GLLAVDVRRRLRSDPAYINRWFTIDLLAAIPFDLIAEAPGIEGGSAAPMLRFLALLRVLRIARVFMLQREWRLRTSFNPAILRLAFFAFWVALLAHWIACGWIAIDGFQSGPADLPPYQSSLYWTITTLTTVGYGDIVPSGQGQTAYTMVTMALGAAMYGYIIGNVASLLANIDVVRSRHLGRIETINNFMRDRGVPRELQARVRDYYNYQWESRMSQQSEMLADLPKPLRVDIALHLNRNILRKVPIFEKASEEFMRELVLQLVPMVFVPGQALMRRGEVGSELFFINKGSVEVLGSDDVESIAVLSDGDFVGEMALLDSLPRANTVRALDYCNVYALDRSAFEQALVDFPDIAAEVQIVADRRRAESAPDD
ncbi:MAG: cyclic nucleotide-binding domain-containing protein, partial [Acidimicrobiia bacterium]|nr:cyclic nucleotide-binding domain-containing protein [Acidimicrobiia bacterium]